MEGRLRGYYISELAGNSSSELVECRHFLIKKLVGPEFLKNLKARNYAM